LDYFSFRAVLFLSGFGGFGELDLQTHFVVCSEDIARKYVLFIFFTIVFSFDLLIA